MLTGLRHGAVGGSHNEDGTIHLGSTGDHVLNIVSVARAVDVGIVTFRGLIFHVGCCNGDATFFFFRSVIDLIVGNKFAAFFQAGNLCDGCCKRGFPMVDVTNGTNIHVWFCTFIFRFCHSTSPNLKNGYNVFAQEKSYSRIRLNA